LRKTREGVQKHAEFGTGFSMQIPGQSMKT
jgi:hypothetical protein